jgi:hypothetical protein
MRGQLSGLVTFKGDHHFLVQGDDGRRYFAFRKSLEAFGVSFDDLKVTMRVVFTPAESDRRRDDPRAIEIKVVDSTTLDGH